MGAMYQHNYNLVVYNSMMLTNESNTKYYCSLLTIHTIF